MLERLCVGLLYGLINAAVVIPVEMSFGAIIFHDPVYAPFLPALIKLTLVSSMVHQLCFSTFSSLPYAIGQVQDSGLIFLSYAASMLALKLQSGGHDTSEILATVTIGLSLCTTLLGFSMLLIGRCKLAAFARNILPRPVVAAYLAFIGFFCGAAGVKLMAGTQTLPAVWQNGASGLKLALPGFLCGLSIYFAVRTVKRVAVLPCCMAAVLLGFYGVLLFEGVSVDEAREAGWLPHKEGPRSQTLGDTYKFLVFDKVVWSALPSQIMTLISMTFVVTVSSSLDIAAIELELDTPLDYNRELTTVGIANVLSGLTGGYSGSYIFSQTIFNLRSGVKDRFAGFTLALVEAFVIVVPIHILDYVPKIFFGSLLLMISADLMFEWLVDVRRHCRPVDYAVTLATFAAFVTGGVEIGIVFGMALHWVVVTRAAAAEQRKRHKARVGDGDDETRVLLPVATI